MKSQKVAIAVSDNSFILSCNHSSGHSFICSVISELFIIKLYCHVVLFIMPWKMVLTFEYVDETQKQDYSCESY